MNVQQISEEPSIEVGILTDKTIRFEMFFPFRHGGKTYPAGRYLAAQEGSSVSENTQSYYLPLKEGEWLLETLAQPPARQACFSLENVCIGIGFHWQRYESQSFEGNLKLISRPDGTLTAVNIISLESYLYCVIASEMKAGNALELLKAHAVISRSWLLAQLSTRDENGHRQTALPRSTVFDTDTEHIRWYERDAHQDFDVCADDHCQRYQGLGKVDCPQVREAIETTYGQVLCSEDEICDARFHKCCGGMTERFDTAWADHEATYLQAVRDMESTEKDIPSFPDLRQENQAREFILHPPLSFCRTEDADILRQIFNDYDQETPHFFRWTLRYTQKELSELLKNKSGYVFGRIQAIEAVQRGASGRIVKLRISGEKKSLIIGKELEIRKFLSTSHLYSSAFTVDCEYGEDKVFPSAFVLHGAGWGHGVGLCQVGAAVMATQGYGYQHILRHYYPQNELKKLY